MATKGLEDYHGGIFEEYHLFSEVCEKHLLKLLKSLLYTQNTIPLCAMLEIQTKVKRVKY